LILKFEDENTPYTRSICRWPNRYGSYDDLARIKEWSAAGGAGGGEA
jgi:ATP-dependent helicase/nuclease subunit B